MVSGNVVRNEPETRSRRAGPATGLGPGQLLNRADVVAQIALRYQTGVKVVCGFEINANQTTELILDFDASRSIVEAGSSDNLLLKPTIRVFEPEEYTIIRGTVTDGENGLQGVLVSVQSFDPDPPSDDPKERVLVRASTITDASGSYVMFIAPGIYSIAAYKDGWGPACVEIEALPDSSHTQDFQLATTSTRTMLGEITITSGSDEQHVTISFRQSTQCSGHVKDIELKSINVLKDGSYRESLPVGDYIVVASTYNEPTQSVDAVITDGVDTVLDFDF